MYTTDPKDSKQVPVLDLVDRQDLVQQHVNGDPEDVMAKFSAYAQTYGSLVDVPDHVLMDMMDLAAFINGILLKGVHPAVYSMVVSYLPYVLLAMYKIGLENATTRQISHAKPVYDPDGTCGCYGCQAVKAMKASEEMDKMANAIGSGYNQ